MFYEQFKSFCLIGTWLSSYGFIIFIEKLKIKTTSQYNWNRCIDEWEIQYKKFYFAFFKYNEKTFGDGKLE